MSFIPRHPATNFDVDYVISFKIPADEVAAATEQYKKLIRQLAQVGLETEVRHGTETNIFIFVKAENAKAFGDSVYRQRIKDWMHQVRQQRPDRNVEQALESEPLTESEKLRHVHHMICASPADGGAGVHAKEDPWKYVESVFPLHDHSKNKAWLQEWTRKTFLSAEDLDQIRDLVGEKIAYYYAFIQSYFTFQIFPAAFGFSCWVLLGHFSPLYAVANGLWCIIFVEYWKRQELDLAIRWNVKGVSRIEDKRRQFRHEKEIRDPITGETVQMFPATSRLQRQLLQVPFAVLAVLALGTVIAGCFGIEIFISEIYDGPFKSFLVFIPTIILTTVNPTVITILTGFAQKLTDYENYDTQEAYDRAMVNKVFVLNFIVSFLPIFLTAFVYMPFATIIVPYLDVFSLTVQPFAENKKQMQVPKEAGTFSVNPDRLRKQVIYFAITAQIVNFALETVVPLLKQKGTEKYQEMQTERAEKKGGAAPLISSHDHPEEKDFLERVRKEAGLEDYDVTTDLREMCIQFGYSALFSVVWPLMPLCYFINNWIEIRGDIFKMTMECKRPVPCRADSIGPWLDNLSFLTWLGSITTAALVYMFSNDGIGPDGRPSDLKLWAILLSVFISEHIYLVVRLAVRTIISKLDTENMRKDRSQRYMIRKQALEDAGLANFMAASPPASPMLDEKPDMKRVSRHSLEDEVRKDSLKDSNPTIRFWNRQRSWKESEIVGLEYIRSMHEEESKKVK